MRSCYLSDPVWFVIDSLYVWVNFKMATGRRNLGSNMSEDSNLSINDPNRELFEACRNGDISKVKKIVNSNNVNAKDTAGRKSSPLHFAAGLWSTYVRRATKHYLAPNWVLSGLFHIDIGIMCRFYTMTYHVFVPARVDTIFFVGRLNTLLCLNNNTKTIYVAL